MVGVMAEGVAGGGGGCCEPGGGSQEPRGLGRAGPGPVGMMALVLVQELTVGR